jgi:hypothetical protein
MVTIKASVIFIGQYLNEEESVSVTYVQLITHFLEKWYNYSKLAVATT